jgi:hypothetical protein
MSDDRLALLEAKVAFIFQVIALTQTAPDGTRITQPLGTVFQETQTHADRATPAPAPVAVPHTDPLDSGSGPGPDGTP